MKKIILFLTFLFIFLNLSGQTATQKALADAYVEKFVGYAVEEMHRSGVPASITLAQGILESDYGRSELAVKANNHFAIQCHGKAWKGKKYRFMDSGEMRDFRKYDSVLESYADHSDFLLKNKRYHKLFELDRTDYKGWSTGLMVAGYAEDRAYDVKLIRIIEMFGLAEYDTMTEVPAAGGKKASRKNNGKDQVSASDKNVVVEVQKEEPLSERQRGTCRYALSRKMYSQNGVPFIYATEGETYSDIARQYDLFLREVLSFNEAHEDAVLPSGAVVYLQAKKRRAAEGYEEYVVEEGMGMREISQKYAVKLRRLCRMNGVDEAYVPQTGEVIRLR